MEPMRHEMMMMDDYDIVNDIIDTMMEVYDELDGAKMYIKEAMRMKMRDRATADSRVTMSAQELGHAETLTATVNKLLDKAKADKHPCYAVMAMFWHHIHSRQAGYMAWIKNLHEQYKK